jgi:hypothetical protein
MISTTPSTAHLRRDLEQLRARYDGGAMQPGVYAIIRALEVEISWIEHTVSGGIAVRHGAARTPPHDIGPDTLYVAYSAWAEMTCFQVLQWGFPTYIFDQHTAYLAATNVLQPMEEDDVVRKRESKGLAAACRAYGIIGWENVDKDVMRKDIGEGRWQQYGKEAVLDYNEEDVRMSTELLRAQPIISRRLTRRV